MEASHSKAAETILYVFSKCRHWEKKIFFGKMSCISISDSKWGEVLTKREVARWKLEKIIKMSNIKIKVKINGALWET